MESDEQRGVPYLPPPVLLVVFVLYALVATLAAPYSWPQRLATGLACCAGVAWAIRRGWLRPFEAPQRARSRTGPAAPTAVWLVLIALAVAVQLLNYFDGPRDVYPTLSSLAGQVFWIYPVRVAAFALWLWLGWYFVER